MSRWHEVDGELKKCTAKTPETCRAKGAGGRVAEHYNSREQYYEAVENRTGTKPVKKPRRKRGSAREDRVLLDLRPSSYSPDYFRGEFETDEEFEKLVDDYVEMDWGHLRRALDSQDESPSEFVAFGRLGLWNGVKTGYSEGSRRWSSITRFISKSSDEVVLKTENGEAVIECSHHDGTNALTIRRWKTSITEDKKEEVLDSIYNGDEDAYEKYEKATVCVGREFEKILENVYEY